MGVLWRLALRLTVSLRIPCVAMLIRVVALYLRARGDRWRLEPVDDDGAGYRSIDQSARDQDRAHHSQAAEDAPHHVITNNQRRRRPMRSL